MATAWLRRLLVLAIACLPVEAWADWHLAESKHFVIYAEGDNGSASRAAARLEKFHSVLRLLSGATAPDSPIKVKVYLVSGTDEVAQTLPFGGGGVAGYYRVSLRGPATVMSRTDVRGSRGSRGEIYVADQKAERLLFHELTHHFSSQYFPAAYPSWYSEGFAEFMGTMEIAANDVVVIGTPARDRYASFTMNDWLPVRKLLVAHSYRDVNDAIHLLYSEGWLLVHYLSMTDKRQQQLKTYLTDINRGKPFDRAAVDAFGDLDTLDKELKSYAARGSLQTIQLPFKKLDPGPITTRALTPAETAMLPFDIRLSAGVAARDIDAFADRVSTTAKRYPDSAFAQGLRFEAARLAGRQAEAAFAANQWLAISPNDGFAVAAQAAIDADALVAAGDRRPASWTAIRRRYSDAARKSPDQPVILHGFYMTYVQQGVQPPESAQSALYRAFEVLPQLDSLRQQVAIDFERRGMIDDAIAVIKPAALQVRDDAELGEGEQRKRDADRARYRIAGEELGEDARETLTRLEAAQTAAKR